MRYKLILRTEAGWDTVGYTQGFDTTADGEQGMGVCSASISVAMEPR